MALQNSVQSNPASYHFFTKLLHWIIAVIIIGLLWLGWYMTSLPDAPGNERLYFIHKSFGILVGVLVLIRLTWCHFRAPTPFPATLPKWQMVLAKISHFLLYVFMIVMPLSGYLGSSFGTHGTPFFGLDLHSFFQPNKQISEFLFKIHYVTAWGLAILVGLHILAAFYHLIIKRDGVFQRMWFSHR